MWQSFMAIGRGTAEGSWRKKKKEKKTSRAFYKSSRTTVTGGLIKIPFWFTVAKIMEHYLMLPVGL